jgi:ABC-type cobalamin/Fe3+-siderophores transport system ATPase subunit
VTHDSTVATCLCNRIIFMERGSVLLDGKPKIVLDRLDEIGYGEYADMERCPS